MVIRFIIWTQDHEFDPNQSQTTTHRLLWTTKKFHQNWPIISFTYPATSPTDIWMSKTKTLQVFGGDAENLQANQWEEQYPWNNARNLHLASVIANVNYCREDFYQIVGQANWHRRWQTGQDYIISVNASAQWTAHYWI